MAQMSSMWTLKIELDGDVRRQRDWPKHGTEPTVESVRTVAHTLFGLTPPEAESLCIRYKNEAGDACTLTEEVLPELLHQCAVLRLIAVVARTPAATPTGNHLPIVAMRNGATHESQNAATSSIPQLAAALLSQHLPEEMSPVGHDQTLSAEAEDEAAAAADGQFAALISRSDAFAKRLRHGAGNFIEQVAGDCQTTCSGIVSGFTAAHAAADEPRDAMSCSTGGLGAEQEKREKWETAATAAKEAAAVAAGVMVAARLLPGPLKVVALGVAGLAAAVATTRLMAHNVADDAAAPTSSQEAEEGAQTCHQQSPFGDNSDSSAFWQDGAEIGCHHEERESATTMTAQLSNQM